MKRILFTLLMIGWGSLWTFAQKKINGIVYSKESGLALQGATVTLKNGSSLQTDRSGDFEVQITSATDTLYISYIGYQQKIIPIAVKTKTPVKIYLEINDSKLEDVEVILNTGYYSIPKERATGSFTHVDNKLLNRVVGGNIMQRLEGIASGVQFVNANGISASDIRVRGLATIKSDEMPLIVLDNFPYEGDIDNINPNDVESITILKDAAAASIWGARAGNGVIVITTKNGRYNQKNQVSINSSMTIGGKPNLLYNQRRLPSEIVMEIEKEKLKRGSYVDDANKTPFPEYVELLLKFDKKEISQAEFLKQEELLRKTETRDQALKYLYQPSANQQYALNVLGGGETYHYSFAAGYDKERSYLIGNENDRVNLSLTNTFKPIKGFELTAGLSYTQAGSRNNGIPLNGLRAFYNLVGLSPYIRLIDENGNALPTIKDYRLEYVDGAESEGLLDWQYRPLEELRLADNTASRDEIRLNSTFRYSFLKHFNITASYQYAKEKNQNSSLYHKDSYYVRNMVNRYTGDSGTSVIPHASIFFEGSPVEAASHSGRGQLNYSQSSGNGHFFNGLIGGEIREHRENWYPAHYLYNYDTELLTGTMQYNYYEYFKLRPTNYSPIPAPPVDRRRLIDRYLSYYSNASYTYKDRYTITGSARWDGSNLFGVKTNQKGTPLWSIGSSWETSKESFYNFDLLPYLRIRTTYGSSGNVNKRVSVFPTISHSFDGATNLSTASLRSAGNPSLRWEKVNTLNLGVDFASKNHRLSGSVDYYEKVGKDLIGSDYFAPSTGIITGGTAEDTNLINYADIKTKGLDLQLTTRNMQGEFLWQSIILLNYVRNKVTHYNTETVKSISSYTAAYNVPLIEGQSRDVIYAEPWNGLDPASGLPIIYIEGQQSTDYLAYNNTLKFEDLYKAGLSVPPLYGSIRNEFQWKGVSVSALVGWKMGYVFRRSSISPGAEYIDGGTFSYHMDYLKRWNTTGDEKFTDVPTGIGENYEAGTYAYERTKALIEKGDHIRLQDINVSYSLTSKYLERMRFRQVKIYAYARNLGTIWRSNKKGIDPDYAYSEFPAPRTFSLGLQIGF